MTSAPSSQRSALRFKRLRGLAAAWGLSGVLAGVLASAAPVAAEVNVLGPTHPLFGAALPPEAPASLRPSRNFYGMTGLIDMPSAQVQPDGEVGITVGSFGGNIRTTLSFQITPRLSGAFRYAAFLDWNSNGFDTYFDRSFDLKYQVLRERRWLPAVAIGLQDFVGTGVLAGEYIVATKTLAPGLFVTGGLGWGRLGSNNPIGNPSGTVRPAFDPTNLGGQFSLDQWFRGEAAPFAGIEYRPTGPAWGRHAGRLGFKLEYSSDAYIQETVQRSMFDRTSSVNFGAEYQLNDAFRLGFSSSYGEIGITLSMSLNPSRPSTAVRLPAPGAFPQRPTRASLPQAYTTDWVETPGMVPLLKEQLALDLAAEGQTLVAARLAPSRAEVRVENIRHRAAPIAIGRIARAMARRLPVTVETFDIVLLTRGVPASTTTFRRSDLEALADAPDRAEQLRALAGFRAAGLTDPASLMPDLYPRFSWALGPYLATSYFDPRDPVLLDLGLRLQGSYEISPGFILEGALTHRLVGNTDNARGSSSGLPNVRSLGPRYAETDSRVERLVASYDRKLGGDVYGRVTGGWFETMYAGVAAEVLWKPVASSLALGAEVVYARQRAFDGGLGFRDYTTVTAHATAYYDWGNGFTTELAAGRYLAKDVGATLEVAREFRNGWRLGAFATLTSASAAEFGEGSFDKGITLQIPLDWALGRPSQNSGGVTLRPVQRDGGARVFVGRALYGRIRPLHLDRIDDEWAQVWR